MDIPSLPSFLSKNNVNMRKKLEQNGSFTSENHFAIGFASFSEHENYLLIRLSVLICLEVVDDLPALGQIGNISKVFDSLAARPRFTLHLAFSSVKVRKDEPTPT